MALPPGMEAPDFEAETTLGEKISLKSLRGRIVVLYFYPRAMTKGCMREAQRFNELLGEFEKYNAVVIGVSTDSLERAKRFSEKLGLKFPLIGDKDGRIARAYDVLKKGVKRLTAERVTFIITPDGLIYRVIRGVRPAEMHADYALKAVKEIAESPHLARELAARARQQLSTSTI